MSKIIAIAWKDTLLRFAGRSEILFFLVLPITFTILIGGATSGSGDNRLPVLLVDEDHGALATELADTLAASDAVRVVAQARAAAEQSFRSDDYQALVIIPAGFTAALGVRPAPRAAGGGRSRNRRTRPRARRRPYLPGNRSRSASPRACS